MEPGARSARSGRGAHEPRDHGLGEPCTASSRESVIVRVSRRCFSDTLPRYPDVAALMKWLRVTHDARFGVALGRCIRLCHIDPARHVNVAAADLVQGRLGLRHVRPVEADLPRERLDGRECGEHQPKPWRAAYAIERSVPAAMKRLSS